MTKTKNPYDAVFNELYTKLNSEQKKAVDTIEGPVMVIAGPGTGKTSILTLRIANILRVTDVPADAILALTFTESGAYAMRKKLATIIGSAAYRINIHTFHGFCNEIIRQYPERFPRITGSTAITDIEQIEIMEGLIQETSLELLRPYGDPFFYVSAVLHEIKTLKREIITPEILKGNIAADERALFAEPDLYHEKGTHKGKMKGEYVKRQEKIEKNKELVLLYEGYETILAKKKVYDFEDMIMEVVKVFRNDEDFLRILQESYQYILADEHQDANNAQNALLELLSNFHESPNLFIVGDEKQAIYRFQGASLENFLYFAKKYPTAVLIQLEHNYRSTQTILDSSLELIRNNQMPEGYTHVALKASKKTKNKGKGHIEVFAHTTTEYEYAHLAELIGQKIQEGISPEDIAVLYRANNDALLVSKALAVAGIEYVIESEQDILTNQDIQGLLLIARAVNNLADSAALAKVLFVNFLNIQPITAFKLIQVAHARRMPLYDVVRNPTIHDDIILSVEEKKILNACVSNLDRWAHKAQHENVLFVIEMLVKESGYLEYILAEANSLERLALLESFFNEIRRISGTRHNFFLRDWIMYLDRIERHGIMAKIGVQGLKKGVRLMTAHKSKGLEFEYVYIVNARDGHWGNKTHRSFFTIPIIAHATPTGHIDDDRRLFYVALTRAKEHVTILYSLRNQEGREQLPSQFIGELDQTLVREYSADEIIEIEKKIGSVVIRNLKSDSLSEKLSTLPQGILANKEYIRTLFLEQGLAVTALNNYLKCPWEYFFVNLIRIPQAQTKHQMYGTAVHETLRTFFDKYREDDFMSKDSLIELFLHNVSRKPLSPHDLEESIKKGKVSLAGYYDTYQGTWNHNLLTEYSVKGVHIPIEIEYDQKKNSHELIVKGQLDKIEYIDDVHVNVVDYKTGKPKSRNDIEGKTKSADGNYKRQLIFYKLLLDRDALEKNSRKKLLFSSAELDFIEPNTSGKFVKERFEIKDDEVEGLVQTISRVSGEIMNLSFMALECGDNECEYCKLAKYIVG